MVEFHDRRPSLELRAQPLRARRDLPTQLSADGVHRALQELVRVLLCVSPRKARQRRPHGAQQVHGAAVASATPNALIGSRRYCLAARTPGQES